MGIAARSFKSIALFACFFSCLIIVGFATRAYAAIDPSDIQVNMTPTVPGANENVDFSLVSYTVNLDAASITWSVNGAVALAGTGQKTFSYTTGALGSTTTVTITVVAEDGESITKTILLQPSELDILWEGANSYVPPFYKGLPLPAREGSVRVVALPEVLVGGQATPASNYIYNWNQNESNLSGASGYGKNAFVFENDYVSATDTLDVTATDPKTNYVAEKNFTISYFNPKILFYEDDPLRGELLGNSLAFATVGTTAETIVAEPYFMSALTPTDGALQYDWQINNQTIATPTDENRITVQSSGVAGTTALSLTVTQIDTLFQKAEGSLSVMLTKS